MNRIQLSILALVFLCSATIARADFVTIYFNPSEWQEELAPATTIDFTGWPGAPVGRTITEQYSHLGIHFTDGNDFILNGQPAPQGTYIDGSGLHGGNDGQINIAYDTLQHGFGVEFPGSIYLSFYREGSLIHQTGGFGAGPLFVGAFVSSGFDAVRVYYPWTGVIAVDNIYFAVPGPGALGVFALATLSGGSRRRRS